MKTTKILGLFALLLMAGFVAQAQNDVIRLKNGSFIRGTIIEYIAGDHVKIKTEEGKIYEFPASELARAESDFKSIPKTYTVKTKGYYNITSIGLMFGNKYGININPGIYSVNGWQWNEHLMTGLGLGMEYVEYGGKFPITADVRYNLLKGSVTPWVGVMGGYTAANKGQMYDWMGGRIIRNYGGVTSGASFGIRAYCGPHVGITANVGYRFQKLKTLKEEPGWSIDNEMFTYEVMQRDYLNRFVMGFGLLFN